MDLSAVGILMFRCGTYHNEDHLIRTDMKRIRGTLLHILSNLVICGFLVLTFEREARAYTDPGSGALLWQMLAAGLFGLVFYLRKLKHWLLGKKPEKKD